jgi:type IX secretion system PorP/SprF family membrane protein
MKGFLHIRVWFILCGSLLWAQEVLPITLWALPQAVSPAQVGILEGRWRASAVHNFRRATSFLDYSTSWFGAEGRFLMGDMPAGAGGYFLSDVAGGLRTTKVMVSFAYEAPLGPKARYDHLRGGFTAGIVQRSIVPQDLYFEDQFDGRGFSLPGTEVPVRAAIWHADYGIGALYYRTRKVPGNVELVPFIGFSASRLNRPALGFFAQRTERLSRLWQGYGGARLYTRSPFEFAMSVHYLRANQSTWVGGSALVEFVLYEGGYWHTNPVGSVVVGAALRAQDQYALMAGFSLRKALYVGAAYSLLTRRQTTPTAFGGLQLTVGYQGGFSYRERGEAYPFPTF